MARPGFRRGSGAVRSQRRLTQWFGSADISAPVSLAAGAAVLDQSLVFITEPITVIRTRGIITVSSDISTQSESPFGALGMAVVSEEALAIGVTAMPTPISNSSSDLFFLHQYFAAPQDSGSDIGFANISQTFAFDSKAMRKISPDENLVVTVENASGVHGLEFILQFRTLIKLA